MSRPPNTPPNSDIDGVAEDELRNSEAAVEAGQDSADLARARKEGIGRPAYENARPARPKD